MFPARDHQSRSAHKRRGVYLAEVTANQDEGSDSRYRVKVKYPWLNDSEESYLARILTPMAGASRGAYFLPEVGDQVLVVFEHGDISRPIVIGGLWSDQQKPPETNADGKNNIRVIKSRSGHRLIFDDTSGAERVILVHSNGKNKVELDAAQKKVSLEIPSGDVEVKATKVARFHGKGVSIEASANAKFSGMQAAATASSQMTCKASGQLKGQAGNIQINPGGGGAAGGGAPTATAVRTGQGADAGEQVTEQGGQGGGGGGGGASSSPGGSPAQREQISYQEAAAAQSAAGPAASTPETSASEITPGEPVEVSAAAEGVGEASCELVDADSGEVLATGAVQVSDGKLQAKVATGALAKRKDVSTARVRVVGSDGAVIAQTPAMAIAGRDAGAGGPSPSDALVKIDGPLPPAVEGPALGPTGGPLAQKQAALESESAAAEAAAADPGGAASAEAQRRKPAKAASAEAAGGAAARGDGAAAGAAGAAAVDADAGAGAAAGAAAGGDVAGAAGAAGGDSGAGAAAAARGDAAGAAGAAGGGAAAAAVSGDAAGVAGAAGGGAAAAAVSGDAAGVAGAAGGDTGAAASAAAAGDVSGAASASAGGGGGVDADVVAAAEAAAEGDAAGATSAVAGDQAGAAVAGDAGGAAGGGTPGAAVEGNVAAVASAEGGAAAGAAASGDVTAAGGAVAGDTAAKAGAVRALDADSPEDFVEDAQRDGEQYAKDESGVAEVEGQVAQTRSAAASTQRDAEHAADVEGRARDEAGDAEYAATSETRGDVRVASDEVRHTQDDAEAAALSPEKQVYESRATLSEADRDAAAAAATPEREAASAEVQLRNETADVQDPEAAARRTQRDAIDSAKRDSIHESRATIEESDTGGAATTERDNLVDKRDRGQSAASDPDREIKSRLRDDLDDD